MILDQSNDVDICTDDEGVDFGVDMGSMGTFFKTFSDTLYSNKIGSIVREITSNCFDAHAEAGYKGDVELTLTREDPLIGTAGKMSFRDFGVGLSPDRIKNIYSKYFASTKRATNDQIGGFGIGAKSPLSYTESFELFTIVESTEYHYLVSRGTTAPRIDLVGKKTTNEPNGTEVIIPIKKSHDADRFQTEIREQLKYFDNITYKNCGVDNNYKIIKGKSFIIRSNDDDKDASYTNDVMQLCIGKVAYPLDVQQVFQDHPSNFYGKFALRFDIGEISVTMNREAVEYKEDTIELIKQRLEEFREEITELRLKTIEGEEDLSTYMVKHFHSDSVILNDVRYMLPYEIRKNNQSASTNWKFAPFKHFKYIKPKSNFMDMFLRPRAYCKKGAVMKTREYLEASVTQVVRDKAPIYRIKENVSVKKCAYISDTKDTSFYMIALRDRDPDTLMEELVSKKAINDGLDMAVYDQEYKTYYKYIMKYFIDRSKSFDKTEVPEEWEKRYQDQRITYVKDKSIITLRTLYGSSFSINKTTVEGMYREYPIDSVIIYGFQGEEYEMRNVKSRLNNDGLDKNHVHMFKIAKDNVKHLGDFKRCFHVSEVEKSDWFKKVTDRRKAAVAVFHSMDSADSDMLNNTMVKQFMGGEAMDWLETIKMFNTSKFLHWTSTFKDYTVCYDELGEPRLWNHKEQFDTVELCNAFKKYKEDNVLLWELLQMRNVHPETEAFEFILTSIKSKFKPFKFK